MNPLIRIVSQTLGRSENFDEQIQRLAAILGVSPAEVVSIPNDDQLRYRRFSIRKRQGSRRRKISAPSDKLKKLQRRLLDNYLSGLFVHHAAHAFRPQHSVATHARVHLGQKLILTCDLKDFFGQTSADRIRAWFRIQGWQDAGLRTLMRLCVFESSLPQGAPTSPILSNLINMPLDEQLFQLAATAGARYSRYADDLVFSWSSEREPRSIRSQVEGCLEQFGYQIQTEKGWRQQRQQDQPEVTGVSVRGRQLRPAQRILERWKAIFKKPSRQQLAGMKGFTDQLK